MVGATAALPPCSPAMRPYPQEMDSEPARRTVRREVVRTERVRREVTVRLGSVPAMRLGAKLLIRGLVAKVRRRPIQLTLRSDTTRPPTLTIAETDQLPAAPVGSGDH
jgi:hypothetical protein